jgi:hypothetical protein
MERIVRLGSRIARRLHAALPARASKRLRAYRNAREERALAGRPPREIFNEIYAKKQWGGSDDVPFFSGVGTHGDGAPQYVQAVSAFLGSLPAKPDVVDLGCGDFHIGAQIRPAAKTYIALDVVDSMIAHHREKFAHLGVDFRVLDASEESLPAGDVVIIRQVLQHLSNDRIRRIVDQLPSLFEWAIVTEHLPAGNFQSNADKPTGPHARIYLTPPSGVVLTDPPFNLKTLEARQLYEFRDERERLTTMAYRLR